MAATSRRSARIRDSRSRTAVEDTSRRASGVSTTRMKGARVDSYSSSRIMRSQASPPRVMHTKPN